MKSIVTESLGTVAWEFDTADSGLPRLLTAVFIRAEAPEKAISNYHKAKAWSATAWSYVRATRRIFQTKPDARCSFTSRFVGKDPFDAGCFAQLPKSVITI